MTAKDQLMAIEADVELLRCFRTTFGSDDGRRVLDWILSTGGFDAGLPAKLTAEERGAQDLARLIFTKCYRADPNIVADMIIDWGLTYRSALENKIAALSEQAKEE